MEEDVDSRGTGCVQLLLQLLKQFLRIASLTSKACSHITLNLGTSCLYTCTSVCMKVCAFIDLYSSPVVYTDCTLVERYM